MAEETQGLLEKGSLIGDRYRIEDLLARRRMGITYRATDVTSGRRCVVKHLSLLDAERVKDLESLKREARILAHLDHPGIPKFIDYLEESTERDTSVYLVQEHIDGKDLAALIESGRHFTERQAVEIALEVVRLLEYLHGFSPPIVHRAIKPSNIMLSSDGTVCLTDFAGVRENLLPFDQLDPTEIGTYGYVPPEQYAGQAVLASDIYSLGVTLIVLLSHADPLHIVREHHKLHFRPYVNVSDRFASVLTRMVDPELERRYAKVDELKSALQELLEPEKPAPARQGRRRALWGGIAVCLAGFFYMLFHQAPPPRPALEKRPSAIPREAPSVPESQQLKSVAPPGAALPSKTPPGGDPPRFHIPFDGSLQATGLKVITGGGAQSPVRFVPGRKGQAVHLGPTGLEYVEESQSPGIFKGSYTVEFWFQVDEGSLAAKTYQPVLRSALWTVDVRNGTTSLVFIHSDQGGHFSLRLHDEAAPLLAGTWYHVAIVRDAKADEFQVLLNGRSFGRRKNTFALGNTLDVLKIGSSSSGPEKSFEGKIDEFAIYDYPRSAEQIARDAGKALEEAKSPVLKGRLFHNGLPVTEYTAKAAGFWLRNESTGKEQKAEVKYQAGVFEMFGLPPGRYGVDVRLRTGEGGRAGDFVAWKTFSVLDDEREAQELSIDLYRIIHMTSPQDNSAGLARWHAQCEGKMSFASPVPFAWEPMGEHVTYSYTIERYRCKPFQRLDTVLEDSTLETRLNVDLPSSSPEEMYLLKMTARNGNLLVGKLETYGINGGRGWDYRFRVE